MPALGTYPRYGEPWSTCTTCGLAFPVSQVRLHYRFGWQCIAPNVWGTDCWAAGPHRDEIRPPYYPGEGARKTAAPPVDPDEGLDDLDDLGPYVFWLYNRSDPTGTFFRVTLTDPVVTFGPETDFTRANLAGRIWGALSINNNQEWSIFIQNNQFGEPTIHYTVNPITDVTVHWLGSYFAISPTQTLLYTPPTDA